MKLLYITEDRFPPFRADVVELFARKLPTYGHKIDWLMQGGGKNACRPELKKWFGNTVYLIPSIGAVKYIGPVCNALLNFLGEWSVIALAVRNRYDVIQVRDKFLACIPAWIAARLTGAKFCYWMSYPFPESRLYLARQCLTSKRWRFYLKGYFSLFLLYKFILRIADHIFVQSEQMLQDVSEHGIPKTKMTPVLMGIRASQVRLPETARQPNSAEPVLLYLGTLVRIRHLEMLLGVLKLVHVNFPRARLMLVGDGENPADRTYLEEETRRLGLQDHVDFTGFIPMARAWEYVERADICLSPFYPTPVLLSTSPTKLIEYLAMAKNVVANDHPEQCAVLAASGVGHCVPWSEKAFSDEVCRLLADPVLAQQQAALGPVYVKKYRTYDVISEQVHHIYKQIIS